MPYYCQFSFAQLFEAAHGRKPTDQENKKLADLSQEQRNEEVRKLAKLSGWRTKDVTSWEGDIFTAFWPSKKKSPSA